MSDEKRFYVYGYIRLDTNTYFYIGKGTGKRYRELHTGRTTHFKNILKATQCVVEILYDNLTEEESLILEQDIIEDLVFNEGYTMEFDEERNEHSYHLINCTYGGEGISGYKYTEEQRKKCARPKEQNGMWGKKGELCPSYGMVRDDDFKDRVRKHNPRSTKCYCIELDRIFDSCRQAMNILRDEYGIKITYGHLSKNLDNEEKTFGTYIETGKKANLHFKRI